MVYYHMAVYSRIGAKSPIVPLNKGRTTIKFSITLSNLINPFCSGCVKSQRKTRIPLVIAVTLYETTVTLGIQ